MWLGRFVIALEGGGASCFEGVMASVFSSGPGLVVSLVDMVVLGWCLVGGGRSGARLFRASIGSFRAGTGSRMPPTFFGTS